MSLSLYNTTSNKCFSEPQEPLANGFTSTRQCMHDCVLQLRHSAWTNRGEGGGGYPTAKVHNLRQSLPLLPSPLAERLREEIMNNLTP